MDITIPADARDTIPVPLSVAPAVATGLVLQGGGALGAFELGAIECLLDSDIRPDVVSGVSIGSINASVLCGHRGNDPKKSLHDLWQDLTTLSVPMQSDAVNRNMSTFGCPGMYRMRTDYWDFSRWTSFYDTTPLVTTLKKHIDFEKLNPDSDAPRLIITATKVRRDLHHLAVEVLKFSGVNTTYVQAGACLPAFRRPRLPRHLVRAAASMSTGTGDCSITRLYPW